MALATYGAAALWFATPKQCLKFLPCTAPNTTVSYCQVSWAICQCFSDAKRYQRYGARGGWGARLSAAKGGAVEVAGVAVAEQLRHRRQVSDRAHEVDAAVAQPLGECGDAADLAHRDARVQRAIESEPVLERLQLLVRPVAVDRLCSTGASIIEHSTCPCAHTSGGVSPQRHDS